MAVLPSTNSSGIQLVGKDPRLLRRMSTLSWHCRSQSSLRPENSSSAKVIQGFWVMPNLGEFSAYTKCQGSYRLHVCWQNKRKPAESAFEIEAAEAAILLICCGP